MGSGNLALRKIYKNETTWIQKGTRKHKCNFNEHCLLRVKLLNNRTNYYNVLKCGECLSFTSIKETGNIQGFIFGELTKEQKSLPVITASYGHKNLIINFSSLDNVCYIGTNYIIKDVYNKIAHLYDDALWTDMPYNEEMDKFASLIKGEDVLDIGCAMGSFTKYISDKGFNVDGIDISSEFINIAKSKVPNVNFQVMDMLDLKINKKYDGIMFINSTIHIEKKNMLELFKNVSRLLKDDGVIFIILLEGDGEKYVLEPLEPSIKEFVNFYTKKEIEEVFYKTGLNIISSNTIVEDADTELGNEQLVYYLRKKN